MFAAFAAVRTLKESLWYLVEARVLLPAGALRDDVGEALRVTRSLAGGTPDELGGFDPDAHRSQVGPLLDRVSTAVRADIPHRRPDRIGADLAGARLRGADLHGASLRGASLLGADLRGTNLAGTDLLGADLRGADLRSARLDGSIFTTGMQLAAARGDAATTLPRGMTRPAHWPAAGRR